MTAKEKRSRHRFRSWLVKNGWNPAAARQVFHTADAVNRLAKEKIEK